MSLSSETMLALMALADGELEGDELARAQAIVASEPDAARFIEQIGGLGDLVQIGHDERSAKAIAAFDIVDSLMAMTQSEAFAPAPEANVIPLAAARAKRVARLAEPRRRSSLLTIGGSIAAALALAASLFLVVQHRTNEAPMAKAPAMPPAAPVLGTAAAAGTGVEVSTVNSSNNSVSVFYLPSANELSTSIVVWVDETGEKK